MAGLVRVHEGRRTVGGLAVLSGVSLDVAAGESVAIVGRSGSGKSTLLACLGLVSPFDDGSHYEIDGTDTTRLTAGQANRLRGSHIGFVFQNSGLLGHLTALANVQVPLMHSREVGVREGRKRAAGVLEGVGLGGLLRRKPRQLSGGERQRVAIARALVVRPRLILADEPTGALDEVTGRAVLSQMFSLVREHGSALVLVTHDSEVARLADRVLTLESGRLHGGDAS